jgi:hypothetical protein
LISVCVFELFFPSPISICASSVVGRVSMIWWFPCVIWCVILLILFEIELIQCWMRSTLKCMQGRFFV